MGSALLSACHSEWVACHDYAVVFDDRLTLGWCAPDGCSLAGGCYTRRLGRRSGIDGGARFAVAPGALFPVVAEPRPGRLMRCSRQVRRGGRAKPTANPVPRSAVVHIGATHEVFLKLGRLRSCAPEIGSAVSLRSPLPLRGRKLCANDRRGDGAERMRIAGSKGACGHIAMAWRPASNGFFGSSEGGSYRHMAVAPRAFCSRQREDRSLVRGDKCELCYGGHTPVVHLGPDQHSLGPRRVPWLRRVPAWYWHAYPGVLIGIPGQGARGRQCEAGVSQRLGAYGHHYGTRGSVHDRAQEFQRSKAASFNSTRAWFLCG